MEWFRVIVAFRVAQSFLCFINCSYKLKQVPKLGIITLASKIEFTLIISGSPKSLKFLKLKINAANLGNNRGDKWRKLFSGNDKNVFSVGNYGKMQWHRIKDEIVHTAMNLMISLNYDEMHKMQPIIVNIFKMLIITKNLTKIVLGQIFFSFPLKTDSNG